MSPAQLLAHFDRISDAPDAIPRLRRFILDLAVRGKLIEQNPMDEPASELLKRIQEEKARLVEEGKIRKQQPLLQIAPEEAPFDIPAKWEWARLGEIGMTQTGTTPSKNHGDHSGSHIPFIKPGDLYANNVDYENEGLSVTGLKDSGRIAPGGSLLMVCIGTIGKCQLIDRDCSFNQQINSLSPYGSLSSRYLLAACLSEYFQKSAWAASARTTIAILNKGKWELLLMPLPPLAEQQRIVAKVEELMALCDRLEASQSEQESRRNRLVASSLNRLNYGADPDAFRNHARFYFNHLPRLTTRIEHIQQLRQTILNLAVRGKLVPQDPNDEPATELLARIRAEKDQLVARNKIRRSGSVIPVDTSEQLFVVPENWVWARLPDLCHVITDGEHLTPKYSDAGVPMLSAKHIGTRTLIFNDFKLVSQKTAEKCWSRCLPEERDVLVVSRGGGVGRTIVSKRRGYCLMGSVLLFKPASLLDENFLSLFLNSTLGNEKLRTTSGASAQQAIYIAHLKRDYIVPLAPFVEQQRIVAKVDELTVLCDRLEAQLTTTQTESRRLLEAVLHDALTC